MRCRNRVVVLRVGVGRSSFQNCVGTDRNWIVPSEVVLSLVTTPEFYVYAWLVGARFFRQAEPNFVHSSVSLLADTAKLHSRGGQKFYRGELF